MSAGFDIRTGGWDGVPRFGGVVRMLRPSRTFVTDKQFTAGPSRERRRGAREGNQAWANAVSPELPVIKREDRPPGPMNWCGLLGD